MWTWEMLALGPFASRREISLAPEVAASNKATWENVVSCCSPAHIDGFHVPDVLPTAFAGLSNTRLNGTFTCSVSKPTYYVISRNPGPPFRSPTFACWRSSHHQS